MFGFGQQRARLLETELLRIAGELPSLGARGSYLVRDFNRGGPRPDTELELLVVLETAEPFHRRADFVAGHVRPRVGTRFFVYTPAEFEALGDDDPIIRSARRYGEVIDALA